MNATKKQASLAKFIAAAAMIAQAYTVTTKPAEAADLPTTKGAPLYEPPAPAPFVSITPLAPATAAANIGFAIEVGATSGAFGGIDRHAFDHSSSQAGNIDYFVQKCGCVTKTGGFGVTNTSESFAYKNVETGLWRGALVGGVFGGVETFAGFDLLPSWNSSWNKLAFAGALNAVNGCAGGAAGALGQSTTDSQSAFDIDNYTTYNGGSSYKITANSKIYTKHRESVSLACAVGAANGLLQWASFEVGDYAVHPTASYDGQTVSAGLQLKF